MRDIIQLRNYHINKGANNDRTPIYPFVKPEGILNLKEYLESSEIMPSPEGTPKFLPSGSDPAEAVSTEFGSDAEVGTVYEEGTIPEGLDGVTSFVSESGKLVTWEYNSVDDTYVVKSVEDIDPNTYYSLAASGVDAYYRYSNVGGTYGITIGMCMRKKYTPELIAVAGVGEAFRIPINPSLYADLSDTSVLALQFSGISVPNKVASALALEPVVGRFKAGKDNVTINIMGNIQVADNNPDIVNNHIYEYNIMDGIISWYDVTPVA